MAVAGRITQLFKSRVDGTRQGAFAARTLLSMLLAICNQLL
ncbi:hypothetical protein X756_17005 [Mesorhizobium sp. LSHC412B00]|nr:hypothetical protein X756_17005 [Mesorhizobium sp. LSHC412B00]